MNLERSDACTEKSASMWHAEMKTLLLLNYLFIIKKRVFIFLYEKSCLFVLYISLYSLYTM